MYRMRMISASLEALQSTQTTHIKFSLHMTYITIVESADGELIEQTVKVPMATINVSTITKGYVQSFVDKLVDALNTQSETLETVDEVLQTLGSGSAIKAFGTMAIDIV